MALPGFLTLAWWAAKWAFAKKTKASVTETVTPWLTPWVVVPVVTLLAIATLGVSLKVAFDRGDTAGYARREQELRIATTNANNRIAAAERAALDAKAENENNRQKAIADIKLLADAKAEADRQARLKASEAAKLAADLRAAETGKVRWRIRNIFKTKTVVVPAVNGTCGVGHEILSKLNSIN